MLARFLFPILITFNFLAQAQVKKSESLVLKTEFHRLLDFVQVLPPDGQIGGFMNYKNIGTHTLLWDLGETSSDRTVIRIYSQHHDGTESFAVSYYRSRDIVPGRTVIRRFVGPIVTGWRNDTIDLETDKYLGTQGKAVPKMTDSDLKLLKMWKVTLLN